MTTVLLHGMISLAQSDVGLNTNILLRPFAFVMITLYYIGLCLITGIGVSMTRDCSTLMVAQYFKRRRELVEIFIVSGSGLGIAVMSFFIKSVIR